MGPWLLTAGLLLTPAVTQSRPFFPISVWYPPSAALDTMKRDFPVIRSAGFNAITTSIRWSDGEPRRGVYNLLDLDRVIAVASETGLAVQVDVVTEPEPSWKKDGTNALAGEFYEYVRRRVRSNPAVIEVRPAGTNPPDATRRAAVGNGAGLLTPRQARIALWSAVAAGSQTFGFVSPESPVSVEVLALGETAGVITRNPALFAPLRPRTLRPGEVTVNGGGRVSVHILESSDALVILAINHSAEVRTVTIGFPPDIPEAIWQNMEAGTTVHFVMGSTGPSFEHTFPPEDALVLAIRKLR